ncbi:MAG: molybdopterin cofactor-binding domain-containing protein, partial [Nitrososphaerota archaeon]
IPNVYYEGYCVYTNRQPSSAMRGYGVFEVSYAVELQMERDARTLGVDSWEFRFKNAYRNGQVTATGRPIDDAYLVEVMKEAASLAGVKLPPHLLQMSSWG